MLGKLIKNDFKTSAHTMGMIYLSAAIAVAFMAFAYIFEVTWISGVATMALLAISVIAVVVTFVLIVADFQRTLFGNQGYLSHTLPVTSGQLVISKTIVSFAWMILSYAVGVAILIGVYGYASAMIGDDVKVAFQLLTIFFEGLPSGATVKIVAALGLLVLFIRIVVLIAQLFFAITLSNTRVMAKFGTFAAIIIFFAVFLIMIIASTVLANYIPLSIVADSAGIRFSTESSMADPNGFTFGVVGTVFNIVCSILLFAGSAKLMDTKINIK